MQNKRQAQLTVSVRVKAGSRKELIVKKEKRWDISVREPAEENRANHRVREILANEYKISLTSVRIIKGHHSPSKLFAISF